MWLPLNTSQPKGAAFTEDTGAAGAAKGAGTCQKTGGAEVSELPAAAENPNNFKRAPGHPSCVLFWGTLEQDWVLFNFIMLLKHWFLLLLWVFFFFFFPFRENLYLLIKDPGFHKTLKVGRNLGRSSSLTVSLPPESAWTDCLKACPVRF